MNSSMFEPFHRKKASLEASSWPSSGSGSGVVLSSMLSVGATISQGTYSDSDDMSTQQRMAASLGQNVASAGGQITRKNLDIQPSLKILAGQAVNILVNKDMIIKPYNP